MSLQSNKILHPLLLLAIAILFVGYLFGPNLRAQFGLLDDHEILTYVQKAMGDFRYFFEMVGSSEVGNFGHSVRYRPGYYTIYVAESLIWGANPFPWYLFRFVMCVTFTFACLKVVDRYYGLACAVLFVALMFAYTYWTDVWSRLGPGESYCAFGWGLFSLGFIELIDKTPPKREWPYYLFILFGVLIGAGGKENFVLLMLPVLALGWIRFRRGTLSWGLTLVLLLSAAYMAVITIELLMAFSDGRPDAHVESVGVGSRLKTLKALVAIPGFYVSLTAFAVGAILWLRRHGSKQLDAMSNELLGFAAVGLCGIFLLFTQVVFYNGEWPANVRFDFPGMMTTPIVVTAAAALATGFVRLNWPKIPSFAIPLLLAIAASTMMRHGFSEVRAGSIRNAQNTQALASKIDLVSKTLKANPGSVLVIETYDAYNYEYIVSVREFVHFAGVTNPIAVRVHRFDIEHQPSELLKAVAKIVVGWDRDSRKDIEAAGKCYSVYLSGNEPTNCQSLAQIY